MSQKIEVADVHISGFLAGGPDNPNPSFCEDLYRILNVQIRIHEDPDYKASFGSVRDNIDRVELVDSISQVVREHLAKINWRHREPTLKTPIPPFPADKDFWSKLEIEVKDEVQKVNADIE